jgi:hypothetical protein
VAERGNGLVEARMDRRRYAFDVRLEVEGLDVENPESLTLERWREAAIAAKGKPGTVRQTRGFWVELPLHEHPDVVLLWALPGGRFAIPARLTIGLLDSRYPEVELDFVLEGGKLVCDAIRRKIGGPPLTGAAMRLLKFDDLVEDVLRVMAIALGTEPDGSWRGRWVKDEGGSAVSTFLDEAERIQLRPKQGRSLTRKHYEAVAVVVAEARAMNRNVLRAIEEEFDASQTTAKRWKREAERLGLISGGPA